MWPFKRKRYGYIKIVFTRTPNGQCEYQFVSHIDKWRMKELDNLDAVGRHGMGAVVQHLQGVASDYAAMISCDVDAVNKAHADERKRGLN